MTHPYETLEPRSFWRSAVAEPGAFGISDLWRPKFAIRPDTPVATAGSCFAQNVSRALKARGYAWLDAEPAPDGMSAALQAKYGFGVFSCRTGNIYTPALLRQWLSWAAGESAAPDEVWSADGRFFDPFRPAIHPGGYASPDDLLAARGTTVRAVRRAIARAQVFVFTLGLTEGWRDEASGAVYPMCPGTVAGRFDPQKHRLHNADYPSARRDMEAAIKLMRAINPRLKILLTVSPVPLTATASGDHVLAATTYSKSTLRALAGDLAAADPAIDYFPSYEIVAGFPFRAMFFEPNMRSVAPAGVAHVMEAFFDAQRRSSGEPDTPATAVRAAPSRGQSADDLACEDELLDAPA